MDNPPATPADCNVTVSCSAVKFRVQSLSELLNSARPAPWIGDRNGYIFGKILGMSEAEIKELKEAGAIR